jgi:hypothetical protein
VASCDSSRPCQILENKGADINCHHVAHAQPAKLMILYKYTATHIVGSVYLGGLYLG